MRRGKVPCLLSPFFIIPLGSFVLFVLLLLLVLVLLFVLILVLLVFVLVLLVFVLVLLILVLILVLAVLVVIHILRSKRLCRSKFCPRRNPVIGYGGSMALFAADYTAHGKSLCGMET